MLNTTELVQVSLNLAVASTAEDVAVNVEAIVTLGWISRLLIPGPDVMHACLTEGGGKLSQAGGRGGKEKLHTSQRIQHF